MTRKIVLIIDLLFVAMLIFGFYAVHQKFQSETCGTDIECESRCSAAGFPAEHCSVDSK